MYGGRWKTIRFLGKGGQGLVYLAEDMAGRLDEDAVIKGLRGAMSQMTGAHTEESLRNDGRRFIQFVREISSGLSLPRAAVKELLPVDHAVNAETALARMKTELDVLKTISHPGLVRVLADRLDERWFAMEYFERGALDQQMDRYLGRPAAALIAIRPIVEALSQVHRRKVVHRDIKPGNVFIGDDDQLVLGDFGLAFKMEGEDRLTDTFENVGTRDYMPGWAGD